MRKHRVYYGFYKNPHHFVEVKKGLFDEWNAEEIRNISHRRIVKWNLRQRGSRDKFILMAFPYIKQGCRDTLRLLGTVERRGGFVNV